MKTVFITTAAIALLALPASAKDFTGPFLGLSAQHTWGEIKLNFQDATTGLGDFSEDQDIKGFEGGLFAGYRYQFPSNFVLGGEIGYQASNADGTYRITDGVDTLSLKFEKNHQFYADLKPGYVFQNDMLAYALVGYQNAKFEAQTLLNEDSLAKTDDNFRAWRFGLGFEYMATENVSIRGQYNYASYSEKDYEYDTGEVESWDGNENVFQLGLSYNF